MVRGRKKLFQYDVCLEFMTPMFFGFFQNSNGKPVKSSKEGKNSDFLYVQAQAPAHKSALAGQGPAMAPAALSAAGAGAKPTR